MNYITKHLRLTLILIGLLIVIVISIASYYANPNSFMYVDNHRFMVAIADGSSAQTRGLGGVDQLPKNQGMYFPLDDYYTGSFWMKDMHIPIDIIWIKGSRVVDINHNVQPQPNATDDQLTRYTSSVEYPTAVLEINGGQAQQLGIDVGDTVQSPIWTHRGY